MELHHSNLNINSTVSLSNTNELKPADLNSLTQSAHAASAKSASTHHSSSSSVVTQLVTGPTASVAAYSDFVKLSTAVDSLAPAQNSIQDVSENAISSEADFVQTQLKVVQQLAAVDREAKAYEQTDAAIASSDTTNPGFDYESSLDRPIYSVSGQASIDTSAVENDPRATLEKAQVIIRAALSAAEPSAADRQVVSQAKALALQAMSELGETKINDESLAASDQVEQKKLELEEFHAKEELRQAKQEKDQALVESRKENLQDSLEVLKEFNAEIHEIQETLRRLNTQLVGTGAFAKAFPQGSLFDQNV